MSVTPAQAIKVYEDVQKDHEAQKPSRIAHTMQKFDQMILEHSRNNDPRKGVMLSCEWVECAETIRALGYRVDVHATWLMIYA